MKKRFRLVVLVLAAFFVVAQFFQPGKNLGRMGANHLFLQEKVPDDIKITLKNACFDCHSDQTTYLWYHKIAPVSWMINDHIREGKEELNFSEWGSMSRVDRVGLFTKIGEEVEHKRMPIKSYLLMHKDARLSEKQTQKLIDWVDETALNLLNEVED